MGNIQLGLGMSSKEYDSSTSMLGEAELSYMIVLLNPATFKVASLTKIFAIRFCSYGTCSTSKERKHEDKLCNFCIHFTSSDSLALHYSET